MAFRMQASAPELMDICQRAEARPRDVRRRAGQAVVRQQLPARPPAGRARRALRAALPRSVGPARQPGQRPQEELRATPTRPAPRWSRTSSSAACSTTRWSSGAASSAARRWCRAATTAATITPTPSRCGWPAAASSRASRSARPTTSASTSSKDRVHVHDLHATILHLLGLRPHAADVQVPGPRPETTGVEPARVVHELLA